MGVLIDTSAIIELERDGASWDRISEQCGAEQAFIPAIVWAELMSGVYVANSVSRALKRREKLEDLRRAVPILEFTADIAEIWAELFAELQKKGRMVPANDLAVISTAVYHKYRILVNSQDEAHFRVVNRVEVITLVHV